MKFLLLLQLLLTTLTLQADDWVESPLKARIRTSYEVIPLTNTRDMGTLGTHFDWHPLESFTPLYTGLGFLSAMGGDEGGFFAFGYTLGIDYELYEDIHIDSGIYVGGGAGRYIAFPNGGMIVRTHASLGYEIKDVELVLGISRTDFPNTTLNTENQTDIHPFFGLNVSNDIWSESTDTLERKSAKEFDGIFQNIRITPAMLYYDVDNKVVKNEANYSGDAAYQANFPALGIQLDKFLSDEIFVSFEAYGALGSAAGYAALQAGLGYEYKVFDYLSWESKMVLGSAGDSRIDTGGGFILQPMTGLRVNLTPSTSIKTLVGRTYAPTGLFSATTYEVGLSFQTQSPIPKKGVYLFENNSFKNFEWYMRPSVKYYAPYDSSHKATSKESEEAISLVGVTMGVPLNEYISITGSTHWAMTGNIGSYAEGLFGLSLVSPSFTPLDIRVNVAAEIGAGAGAGVNTSSGGYITQLSSGLEVPLSKKTSLNVDVGHMKTSDGKFKALTALLGLTLHLNYISKK